MMQRGREPWKIGPSEMRPAEHQKACGAQEDLTSGRWQASAQVRLVKVKGNGICLWKKSTQPMLRSQFEGVATSDIELKQGGLYMIDGRKSRRLRCGVRFRLGDS